MAKQSESTTVEKNKNEYTKTQVTTSKRYSNDIDIVNALLQEDKTYTLDEVDGIIDRFKKGKVE